MLSNIPGQSDYQLTGIACALLRDEGIAAKLYGHEREPPFHDERLRTEWLIGYDGAQPTTSRDTLEQTT